MPLNFRDAAMRYLAFIMPLLPLYTSLLPDRSAISVSVWLCLMWFLPILVRQDRRGMHDQICNMRMMSGKVKL